MIVNRIISAKDYAKREGVSSVRELVKRWSARMYQKGQLDTPFVDGPSVGKALVAKINHGQWIAHCDQCRTAMWVEPDDPFLYCYGCGNRITGGRPRPVIFPDPEVREKIEQILLERPVDDRKGTNDIDRAFTALPLAIGVVEKQLVALERSWKPEETVEMLMQQNGLIDPLMQKREELGLKPTEKPAFDAYKEAFGYFAKEVEILKPIIVDQEPAPVEDIPVGIPLPVKEDAEIEEPIKPIEPIEPNDEK